MTCVLSYCLFEGTEEPEGCRSVHPPFGKRKLTPEGLTPKVPLLSRSLRPPRVPNLQKYLVFNLGSETLVHQPKVTQRVVKTLEPGFQPPLSRPHLLLQTRRAWAGTQPPGPRWRLRPSGSRSRRPGPRASEAKQRLPADVGGSALPQGPTLLPGPGGRAPAGGGLAPSREPGLLQHPPSPCSPGAPSGAPLAA